MNATNIREIIEKNNGIITAREVSKHKYKNLGI